MKKSVLLILCFGAFFSCNNDASKVEVLEKEVLTLHDEVMPKMDQIMSLQGKLKNRIAAIDSIQLSGVSSNTIAEERMKVTDLYKSLHLADSLMMDWMYKYDGDSARTLPTPEAMGYFENQKLKMLDVQVLTNKSIQEAETFLNQQ